MLNQSLGAIEEGYVARLTSVTFWRFSLLSPLHSISSAGVCLPGISGRARPHLRQQPGPRPPGPRRLLPPVRCPAPRQRGRILSYSALLRQASYPQRSSHLSASPRPRGPVPARHPPARAGDVTVSNSEPKPPPPRPYFRPGGYCHRSQARGPAVAPGRGLRPRAAPAVAW